MGIFACQVKGTRVKVKSHRGTQKVQEYIRFLLENSFFLIIGTAAGLIWANVNWPSYERITHQIHFAVNDIGMVFFFGIAAKEVFEAILPGGTLASPSGPTGFGITSTRMNGRRRRY